MIFIFSLVIILALIVIVLFSFPRFSPIPYFPSNYQDKDLILQALDLKNNQIIIDLGAGDGWVIFEAAKLARRLSLNTKFIAVEINPVLIILLHIKRLLNSNKNNVAIIYGDIFAADFPKLTTDNRQLITIYIYISPWLIEKTVKIIKKQFGDFNIVSYFYPVKSLKRKEKVLRGKHNVYIYN